MLKISLSDRYAVARGYASDGMIIASQAILPSSLENDAFRSCLAYCDDFPINDLSLFLLCAQSGIYGNLAFCAGRKGPLIQWWKEVWCQR